MGATLKLTALNPTWASSGGAGVSRRNAAGEMEPSPERIGVGVMLDCPCGDQDEDHRLFVPFANPLDGAPSQEPRGWQRTGDTFETLTLSPSVYRRKGCGWHGWIRNGEVISC